MAITRRRAAFSANKVAQIVAPGLLYALNMVTNFLQVVGFSPSKSQTKRAQVTSQIHCIFEEQQIVPCALA